MILTSIDLPGTWERAPFPIEYVPVPGTVLDQANTVFWMNNSKGSEAAIFIEIHGFASVDGANGSYHGTVEHVSWDYVSTLNFGDQGCSFEKTNASISCHGKEVIWSHGYYMVFQKMNYWVGMVIVSQDSYNITSNQVERLAQVQELAVT